MDALSTYLGQRREHLLHLWREAVRRDAELTTSAGLSRSALDDHIPSILDDFAQRLRVGRAHRAWAELQQRRDAAEHGLHRWQQGYDIREALREWGHLESVILHELDQYAQAHPQFEPGVLSAARQALVMLCMEGTCESATRYVRLQQAEAASRVRDLESSLRGLQALEDERSKLLRETAHDLRGSVGVLASTTALLAKPQVAGAARNRFHNLLQHRIQSMGALLTDLVELARLEAGQTPLKIEPFDAAERLRGYCEMLRPAAAERNLFLKWRGPTSLRVEGDPVKLQRIVQNLLLNALKATQRGGVVVRWSAGKGNVPRQWLLSIGDTGPGFALQSAGPLRQALKHATDVAQHIEVRGRARRDEAGEKKCDDVLAARSGPGSATLPSGEGIGLSIVKRLCEVLGATLALETAPGHGTTIRIAFPMRYSHGDSSTTPD
ncbi:MAG TPA: HAMP domain-containing sensor histidine kinase [Steroidobacteraceae bacterium]|nr:HAMP domain-containing sensor histidine kinase [Steroidobacteraceae bacterium]